VGDLRVPGEIIRHEVSGAIGQASVVITSALGNVADWETFRAGIDGAAAAIVKCQDLHVAGYNFYRCRADAAGPETTSAKDSQGRPITTTCVVGILRLEQIA
jgi:hypothetical protein